MTEKRKIWKSNLLGGLGLMALAIAVMTTGLMGAVLWSDDVKVCAGVNVGFWEKVAGGMLMFIALMGVVLMHKLLEKMKSRNL